MVECGDASQRPSRGQAASTPASPTRSLNPSCFAMNAAATHRGLARPTHPLGLVISGDKHALRPDDSLRSAGNQMRTHHAGAWPVVKDRTIIGVIQGPNPDWRAQRFGHDPELSPVAAACKCCDVEHCYDDEDCINALDFMLS